MLATLATRFIVALVIGGAVVTVEVLGGQAMQGLLPMTLSPGAAWAAGLLSGAVLLVGWGFHRRRSLAATGGGDS